MPSSPRKRRIGDTDETNKTPTKVKREELEKNLNESIERHTKAYMNMSWADMSTESRETEVSVNIQKVDAVIEVDVEDEGVKTRSRKNKAPRRNNEAGKAKFEKALDLNAALGSVKSERIKKLEEEKRRVEIGSSPRRSTRRAEKRERDVSISSVSTTTPNSARRPRRKNPRVEDTPDRSERSDMSAPSTPRTPRNHNRLRLKLDDGMSPKPKENYVDPKVGWCDDEATLKRRAKELEKAKEKDVYQRYAAEVPKASRQTGVHPRTPNKYLNYSRRNWDAQVRTWKRALYEWAGESCPSSVNTSRASSVCGYREDEETENKTEVKKYQSVLENPDNVASIMGHWDINTRTMIQMEESTLKAPTTSGDQPKQQGPVDFNNLLL